MNTIKSTFILIYLAFICLSSTYVHAIPTYSANLDPSLFGNLKQQDVCGLGPIACGPTASINSFIFLQKKYPSIYDSLLVPDQTQDKNGDGKVDAYDHMISAALSLAGPDYMNTAAGSSTEPESFTTGKTKYIEKLAPNKTKYKAEYAYQWRQDIAGDKPEFVSDMKAPTWEFLFNELKHGEDIELYFRYAAGGQQGAHYVTLTGFHWEDQNSDGVIDQNEATIDYIDPFTGMLDPKNTIYESGDRLYVKDLFSQNILGRLDLVVSESPIPEPSYIVLLSTGLILIGLIRLRSFT